MNRLPLDDRTRVLAAICEGMSIRSAVRMTGVAKNTIQKLLREVGQVCDAYQHHALRGLKTKRVQMDEIWSFCHTKERNLKADERGTMDRGDQWTWTAIDADSKLIITWHLGKRTSADADAFVKDLAPRIVSERVQITTDGFGVYVGAIQAHFRLRADYGTEVKDYGLLDEDAPERKYSPMVVKAVTRKRILGNPNPDRITTAYVERHNLTIRMQNRRFTRLTNAFSKKSENHSLALALHFMYYNYCKVHGTIKTTPAIAAGVTDRVWTVRDLALLADRLRELKAA